jgi:NADH-quinone oxidoreductase subunit D
MIEGGYLADVPIIIAAIDPCFSCTDRMIKVRDTSTGSERMFNWEGLRSYSIEWYNKQGIDLKNIRALRKEDRL